MSCSEDKVILIAALKDIEWNGGVSPNEYPTCPSCLEEKYPLEYEKLEAGQPRFERYKVVSSRRHANNCQLKAALRLEDSPWG